jgi:hypothetical protein
VFKYFVSDAPGKKRRSIKKKRAADNFSKARIRHLIYRRYSEVKIHVMQ